MKKYRKVAAILLTGILCAGLFPIASFADAPNGPDFEIAVEEETAPETEPESETEPEIETEPESEPEIETEPGSERKPESETNPDITTEIDCEPDCETESEEEGYSLLIPIDDRNFPDSNFRSLVLSQYDYDKDKALSQEEIGWVTIMTLDNKNISDLSGIRFFTSLKHLGVDNNNLSELNLNGCTSIETISCNYNQLSKLDVRGCTALTELECYSNQLTVLDLSDSPALQKLDCNQNKLGSLDVTKCKALKSLNCTLNSIVKLNVKGCTSLEDIHCVGNSLSELDVSGCTSLTVLGFAACQTSTLKVSGCKSLKTLNCASNKLTDLDLKDCPVLSNLECYRNSITNLNIGRNRILADCYRRGTKTVENLYVEFNIDGYGNLKVDKKVAINASSSVTEIFDDVKAGAWYVNSVQYVYDNGIMVGNGNIFKPNARVKREEFVRVLYNHSKTPKVTISNPYPDVVAGAWYEQSVLWAKEKNIANGKPKDGKDIFGVGQEIQREELALMIYKYAKLQGYNMAKDDTAINKFSDSKKVSTWAKDAMNWAVSRGVMSGKGAKLDPQGNATRAECASMIKNMIEKTAPK